MSGPTLESLRAQGADCHDPVRYRYLQALAERLPLQPPAVQDLLARRLQHAVAAYAERVHAIAVARPAEPAAQAVPSPLARLNREDPRLVDVYELIINGQEISPGYSELNDPDVQRERLEHQSGDETQKVDYDFIETLEHGMPPAGGIGIGIDRLIMMLAGASSIRDVVLFPQLTRRPSGGAGE